MAWCRLGDKPLFQPTMVQFIDAYMRHSVSMRAQKIFIDCSVKWAQYNLIGHRVH